MKKYQKIYRYNRSFKKLKDVVRNPDYGICPAPLSAQDAINVLCDYLLGEDWYYANSCNTEQGNSVIVDSILAKYSKEYVKDWRYHIKHEN